MSQDRLKQAFRDLQRLDPMLPYQRIYRAKVVGQSGDLQRVDVRPFDPSLPDMAGIELRHGVPGIKVQVAPGCSVQVGWDDGKPDRPFAALWSTDATAIRVVIPATALELGSENPVDFAMLGTTFQLSLTAFLGILTAYVTAIQAVADPTKVATPPMLAGITALAATPYLSSRVRIGK